MGIAYAAATHEGVARRINEDAFLLSGLEGEEPRVNQVKHAPAMGPMGFLAAVADGFGGAVCADEPSREALAAFAVGLFGHWSRFPREASEPRLVRALGQAARGAGEAVRRYAEEDADLRGMSATLSAAVIWNQAAYLCQVGSGGAWLQRGDALHRLTPGLAADPGYAGQAGRNTQSLGTPLAVAPTLCKVRLRRGDRLVLCTDGVWRSLHEARILELLKPARALKTSAERLLKAALEEGAADDVTALLLAFDDVALPLPRGGAPVRPEPLRERRRPGLLRLLGWRRDD
jgi:protein phosphatase